MKLRMAENSLFAILLRSPWWISIAVGLAIGLGMAALLPSAWKFYGVFAAAPFLVIGAIASWRQFRAPSAARIDRSLAAARTMPSNDFAGIVEARLRADGYDVSRLAGGDADFEAQRASRRTLVSCRRFKTARTGIKPLQELHAAVQAREADDAIYVVAGDVTDQARKFAAGHRIRVVQGAELAAWLPALARTTKR